MNISGYRYSDSALNCSHAYLLPAVFEILEEATRSGLQKRVFDLGCGNGSVANMLRERGFHVVGVDPSLEGIRQARSNFPTLRLEVGSTESDLSQEYGRFPIVLSLEVVEHVFLPRQFARRVFDLVEAGGIAVISTPYHGYLKNLALAVAGKMDEHFTALWDYGHIKFWSVKTLSQLLLESGFSSVRFRRVGRIPPLAKSMIAVAKK